ncbi:MAG: hypothetical protein PWR06_349 [Thermoanaerobacteraceae bacterium]|jgi:hypothetical protein|uniref:DUF3189 family protein n=1 Tax=Biomaibacter acetigenes TaxID=2316383 RepID=A0A3G2R693_9FIRM|nr:DUF3189 family protein [Biomaibacter acetigenes]AYO30377.1 DUF3189 family protein [Biomaibacter acetigenes]MDK2877633.1 hypothetical protein [Thermoanaerobacteraceae bacterium]MDN5300543.1 hypothetical protein [Thermoanaerobacteraceae bacterium]RKL63134.1 DUF3189 family protein [Thermoanaerobacteraceae bacterium SP2]
MKIFYYCYGSAHSSVVAACIHLGILPTDRLPSAEEFKRLPHYDKTDSYEIGTPFFMGIDEYGAEIFITGMTGERQLVKKAIYSFLKKCGIDVNDLMMVNALNNVNLKTKIGGFISRRLGLVTIGRPLTIKGIQEKYAGFVTLVENTKREERKRLNKT